MALTLVQTSQTQPNGANGKSFALNAKSAYGRHTGNGVQKSVYCENGKIHLAAYGKQWHK